MSTCVRLLGLTLIVCAWPALCLGQTRLEGRVTDPNGAPVPQVHVMVTPLGTTASIATAQTSSSGEFTFSDLMAGSYVVRSALAGFVPTERRVALNAGGNVRLELQLVLALSESLSVVGELSTAIPLDIPSDTGSRLGLTARELPSSLEVVTQAQMEERGHRTVQEAVESAIGVTVGDHPSDTGFTTRGFSQNGVPVFYEGIKVAVPNAFQTDAWNLESIEVLKGPASSLYGEGAVGGAVNFSYRRPDRGPARAEGAFTYGAFNTVRLGLGAGGPLGDSGAHYRIDYGLNTSDGFIDRNERTLSNLTSALAWDLSSTFNLQVSFDIQHDDFDVSYWGTPLVPATFALEPIDGVIETPDGRTIDRRMSRLNYNASEVVTKLDNTWTQVKAQWQPAQGTAVRNVFYHSLSDRAWKNAEAYSFNSATNLIDRDRFFVSHGVTLVGNRFDTSVSRPLGGFANRFLAGFDVSAMEFLRVPRYRGDVDSVDPLTPSPGVFGPLQPLGYTTQHVNTAAFFVEDYFSLRSDLKLALSARAERIDADHGAFVFGPGESVTTDPSGGTPIPDETFGRVFTPVTWKAGLIYDTASSVSVYGHVATSADPADADLVFGVQDFDMATGRQVEVGAKQSLAHGLEWTAAYYWLVRKNVLTQTSPTTSDAVGQQSTRGIEFSFGARPIDRWQIRATATALDAQYDDFKETVDDVLVSRDGNQPPNVPNVVVDLQTSVRLGGRRPAVEVGGVYRYVGERFNGLDNSVRMLGYNRADAFAIWTIDRLQLTGRVRNLFDEDYANWGSQFYTTQVSLGAPRSAEIELGFRF